MNSSNVVSIWHLVVNVVNIVVKWAMGWNMHVDLHLLWLIWVQLTKEKIDPDYITSSRMILLRQSFTTKWKLGPRFSMLAQERI